MKGWLTIIPFFYEKYAVFRPITSICGSLLIFLSLCQTGFCEGDKPAGSRVIKEMTLADCVFLAVRSNRSIKSAYLDRVVQKFDLKVAEDEFIPNVDVTSSVKHSSTGDGDNRLYINSGEMSATVTEKIPTGADFTFTWANIGARTEDGGAHQDAYTSLWGFTLSQPLLKGAGIEVNTASLETARINEKINILSLKSTISDIITSAITAYRSFVEARKQLEINSQSLERAKELLEVNKALISAGRMAKVDIVQTQSDVANREFGLLQAENTLDAARLALLKVLDIDKYTMVVPVEKTEIKRVRPDLSRCHALALQNRRDYLQALLNLKTIELDLVVAKNNRLWDLSLEGGYGISGDDDERIGDAFGKSTNANRSAWNVGLILSIPLYGDLTREQTYLGAKINLKKAKISVEELKENIEIEVLDAVRDVEMKLRQVELARQARELSEKKLEIEKEKLKAGRSTNFQLVSFQNDLIVVQSSELNANIAYLNALTSLDNVLGTTLDTWKIEIKEE
jgi:outer membrane protein